MTIMRKKVLITAGSTWVKIDEVRVLANRFTGRTGIELARALKKAGYDVTLLINPHCVSKELTGLKTVEFFYYEEFVLKTKQLLEKEKFDIIIHTAAVSDYLLPNPGKGKIPSGKKSLTLKLKPAQKVIKIMRALAPEARLVQFKLEKDISGLISKAAASLKMNGSDLAVANCLGDIKTKYLLDKTGVIFKTKSLAALARRLGQ